MVEQNEEGKSKVQIPEESKAIINAPSDVNALSIPNESAAA